MTPWRQGVELPFEDESTREERIFNNEKHHRELLSYTDENLAKDGTKAW